MVLDVITPPRYWVKGLTLLSVSRERYSEVGRLTCIVVLHKMMEPPAECDEGTPLSPISGRYSLALS